MPPSENDIVDDAEAVENNDHGDDEDKGVIVRASDMTPEMLVGKKKKKKSKKSKSQRGMGKPTGFEDNFADPPQTPEQYAELREIFHPDIPFVERILRAIQRFERTRKLSPERRDVFYKYLAYGGVDVGPNMFQGEQDTSTMDRNDVDATLAQASISEKMRNDIGDPKAVSSSSPSQANVDDGNNDSNSMKTDDPLAHLGPSKTLRSDHKHKYTVDFHITMRAFLSRKAASMFTFDTLEQVKLVTTTLERFMDYLLQNDVCPEYADEVLSTRNLCRTATAELWDCAQVFKLLPGYFNMACSTVFGGQFGQDYDGVTHWEDETGVAASGNAIFGRLSTERASQIIGFVMATEVSVILYQRYEAFLAGKANTFTVAEVIHGHGFEIISIEVPSEETLKVYRTNAEDLLPVGAVQVRFWHNPESLPLDLSPEEQQAGPQPHPMTGRIFHVYLEQHNILHLLKPGQKIECTLYRLDSGLWFFDEVLQIFPSFEVWIENEMTYGWKEPKALPGVVGYPLQDDAQDLSEQHQK